jgi:hypothetical protein
MTTITLYECDISQDSKSVQLLSLRLTFAVYWILYMDPDTFYFYFYNMNLNTHALEKISAYFYMAHPYDCN